MRQLVNMRVNTHTGTRKHTHSRSQAFLNAAGLCLDGGSGGGGSGGVGQLAVIQQAAVTRLADDNSA